MSVDDFIQEADYVIKSAEDEDEHVKNEIGYGEALAEAFKENMEQGNLHDLESNLASLKEKYSEFKSECMRKEVDAWEKSQTSS